MAKVRNKVRRSVIGDSSAKRSSGFYDKNDINVKYKILQRGGRIDFPVDPEDRERMHGEYLEEQFHDGKRKNREYIVRKGEDYKADTPKKALELYKLNKISKSELPIIAFSLGLINDPDDCSINKALGSIKKAAQGQVVVEEDLEELVKSNFELVNGKKKINKRKKKESAMSPEERLEYQRRVRKNKKNSINSTKADIDVPKLRFKKKIGQYGNEAYTGNGGSRPGTHTEQDVQLETPGNPERYKERKRKLLPKNNLQPKTDTDGEIEQYDVEDPRNEGLKSAMKNISSELDSLSVGDLQEIKDQVAFLVNNNKKSSIVISERSIQMPSPEDIVEQLEFPEVVDDLRSNFN